DDQDLGIIREPAFLAHVLFQRAESPGEGDLLLGRELLVAEDHDLMLEERLRDLRERVVVEGTREIDAGDFGAETLAESGDRDHDELRDGGAARPSRNYTQERRRLTAPESGMRNRRVALGRQLDDAGFDLVAPDGELAERDRQPEAARAGAAG